MSAYTYLKSQIASVIKNNGNREITGDKLQTELFRLIDATGNLELRGYMPQMTSYSPSPAESDSPCMYLAGEKGTFTNFGNLIVTEDICFLCWDGVEWFKVGVNALQIGEAETTAYRGDRGKTAYDHSQSAHAPSDATRYTDGMADLRVALGISGKENTSSKTNTLNSSSTTDQYPNAKITYDTIKASSGSYSILNNYTIITYGNSSDIPSESVSYWNALFETNKFSICYSDGNDLILVGDYGIKIPDNLFWNDIVIYKFYSEAVSELGTRSFSQTGLFEIRLPNAKKIGNSAFKDTLYLTHVYTPSVIAIENMSFYGCTSLVYLDLTSCTQIGGLISFSNIFDNIQSLQQLIIPVIHKNINKGQVHPQIDYLLNNNTVLYANGVTYIGDIKVLTKYSLKCVALSFDINGLNTLDINRNEKDFLYGVSLVEHQTGTYWGSINGKTINYGNTAIQATPSVFLSPVDGTVKYVSTSVDNLNGVFVINVYNIVNNLAVPTTIEPEVLISLDFYE